MEHRVVSQLQCRPVGNVLALKQYCRQPSLLPPRCTRRRNAVSNRVDPIALRARTTTKTSWWSAPTINMVADAGRHFGVCRGTRTQKTVLVASNTDTKEQQRHRRRPRPRRRPRHHFSDAVTGNQAKSATVTSEAKPVRDGDAQWAQMMAFHPRKTQHPCPSDNKKGVVANVAAERHVEEVERLRMPQVVQLRVVAAHATEMTLRTRSRPMSDFPSRPSIYIPLPLHLDLRS